MVKLQRLTGPPRCCWDAGRPHIALSNKIETSCTKSLDDGHPSCEKLGQYIEQPRHCINIIPTIKLPIRFCFPVGQDIPSADRLKPASKRPKTGTSWLRVGTMT